MGRRPIVTGNWDRLMDDGLPLLPDTNFEISSKKPKLYTFLWRHDHHITLICHILWIVHFFCPECTFSQIILILRRRFSSLPMAFLVRFKITGLVTVAAMSAFHCSRRGRCFSQPSADCHVSLGQALGFDRQIWIMGFSRADHWKMVLDRMGKWDENGSAHLSSKWFDLNKQFLLWPWLSKRSSLRAEY